VANSVAASAAYWIGSAAGEFYATPSADLGSIGVYQAHQDFSAALEKEGVRTTLIVAGRYKVEGNPYGPLDRDARAFMQGRVDEHYTRFVRAVARNRSVPVDLVRNGMGQGRLLGAQVALKERMVDGIATIDKVVRSGRQGRERRAQRQRGLPARSGSEGAVAARRRAPEGAATARGASLEQVAGLPR
jgi:ClpP class serine protease